MRGFLLDLRDGAMAAAPEDSERRAARDVASWRLEQQEEAVVLGLIGTETGITALVRLAEAPPRGAGGPGADCQGMSWFGALQPA